MAKAKPDFIQQFRAARSATVPLVQVRTYDHSSAIRRIVGCFKKETLDLLPVLMWDCANGLVGYNNAGKAKLPSDNTQHPVAALKAVLNMPPSRNEDEPDALVFFSNIHRFWSDNMVKQMLWNMRDRLKVAGVTLCALTGPSTPLPEGLTDDFVVINEALPTETELRDLVARRMKLVGRKLSPEQVEKAVDAVSGLALFPAETALAMELTAEQFDSDMLWERKRQTVEQSKLTVWRGGESFAKLGGSDNLKNYLARYAARKRPRAILFIDEIQRGLAGHQSENTGTKSGFIKKLLTWMQDGDIDGVLLYGPAGTGKSGIAKAAGNEAQCPTIVLEIESMQQKELGSSEENFDRALGTVDAVSQGKVLVMATTNNAQDLPSELRRRFKKGTFFCDLPGREAQEQIWRIYEEQFNVGGQPRPDYTGWTGAEIRECCEKAAEMGYTLVESAQYIVPVCRANAEGIRMMRAEATGRYIDAEQPGIYDENREQSGKSERKLRSLVEVE